MTIQRKGNLFFGDEYPSNPKDTRLWIRTDQNTILRYNGSSWVVVGTASSNSDLVPLVVSASPSINNGSSGNQTAINGYGFSDGANVKYIGNDGTEYSATQVNKLSTVKLISTQPALPVGKEPYSIKVINSNSTYSILDSILDVGSGPEWITSSGSLGEFFQNSPVSASVVATDQDNQTVTYTSNNFSVPGLTLGSNGVISGVSGSVQNTTVYNFNINASDGPNSTSRSFNLTITSNPLSVVGSGGLKYSFNADNFIVSNTLTSWPAVTGLGSTSNISATQSTSGTVVAFNSSYKAVRTNGNGFPGWKVSDSSFSGSWVSAAIVFTTDTPPSSISDAIRFIQGRFGSAYKYMQIIRAGGGGTFVLDHSENGNALSPSRSLVRYRNYVIVTKWNPTTGASQTLFDDDYNSQTYTATLVGNNRNYYYNGGETSNVWGFGEGDALGGTRNIDIAAVTLWDSELTLNEMKTVMAYYKNKYGI
jgi:hypothetical protein